MRFCQFCQMYMKPFVDSDAKTASCEFCGEIIAKWNPNKPKGHLGRWELITNLTPSK